MTASIIGVRLYLMPIHSLQTLQISKETHQAIRISEQLVRDIRTLIKQTGVVCQISTELLDRQEESRLGEEIRKADL